MPSFDVVSEIKQHELNNAIDQANREIGNRFDFKGSDSKIELNDDSLTLQSASEFQIKQIHDILENKVSKRGIDVRILEYGDIEETNNRAKQTIAIKKGIDTELAKKIVKLVKETKMKVQANIQGDQIRIMGKKRDDLQEAIAKIKEAKYALPLQFVNFRD